MSIRIGLLSDIPGIMAIEHIPEYRPYIASWTREEHRSAMESADAEYLVAVREDVLSGFAILQGIRSEHRSILLRRIAVSAPQRGLGRELLLSAADRVFQHHGAHRLWLDVFVTNPRARHLYASCGFRVEGLLRDSIRRDGNYHSQVVMSLLDYEYTGRQQQAAAVVTRPDPQ
ncbi:MAG: GCN5-related N-acetyltransferase [Acidobacteriaceae bacterium]|nr:GCN5-related N-acetyltransferase [Acidobacteriaceae bacterium]